MGVDGFRVDAVPYLIEREGTSCESLPETHDVAEIPARPSLDEHFPGTDAARRGEPVPRGRACPTSADGDEFHMAFHFPLMPRMFMALRLEDRKPLVDIVERTPQIPETCQWGMFLRNHDELTLEMVNDIERDYMYDEYASDPAARLNLGIRRRLAPLLEGDRRRIELMNGLLMSLPGSADHLLRRRDRHGRQHLSRRPQRRAHAHAVERWMERADFRRPIPSVSRNP